MSQDLHSKYWGFIHLMLSVSRHSTVFSSSSDYCVLLETVPSVLLVADLGLRFLRSFTLATVVCMHSCISVTFCFACSSVVFFVDCPLAVVCSESGKKANKHFQKFSRSRETWHNLDFASSNISNKKSLLNQANALNLNRNKTWISAGLLSSI